MAQRLRVFIDFWNFQLNWNDRTGKAPPDWPKVPLALAQKARDLIAAAGLSDNLVLHETRVTRDVMRDVGRLRRVFCR